MPDCPTTRGQFKEILYAGKDIEFIQCTAINTEDTESESNDGAEGEITLDLVAASGACLRLTLSNTLF